MHLKNLRGVSEFRFEKIDSFTLETSEHHPIRNFFRNERVRVKNRNSKIMKLICQGIILIFFRFSELLLIIFYENQKIR